MSPRTQTLTPSAVLIAELGPLYAFVSSRVGNQRAVAEDLTQETLLAAVQGRFDPAQGALRAWLFGIAVRKLADHERKKRISRDHLEPAARELAVRMIREPLPDEWLARDEIRGVVNRALAALPDPMAGLLVRKYFDGASVAELSVELGVSEKAVESQLTRARVALHEQIQRFAGENQP